MGILSGQQGGAGGAATGGVVEVSELEPTRRQPVQVGGGDLAAVATYIGVAHIIGQDEDDVGRGRVRHRSVRAEATAEEGEQEEPAHVPKVRWNDEGGCW